MTPSNTDSDADDVETGPSWWDQPDGLALPWTDQQATAGDSEPRFVLAAHDILTTLTVGRYIELCGESGQYGQARQATLALAEIYDWQDRNPDQVRHTHHQHTPVTPAGPNR